MTAEYYRLTPLPEFDEWLNEQGPKSRYQVDARLLKIQLDGHFGTINNVSKHDKGSTRDQVWKLKFNDGRRIYYAYLPEKNLLLLLGGNKNGQDKDINNAKRLYVENTEAQNSEKKNGKKRK